MTLKTEDTPDAEELPGGAADPLLENTDAALLKPDDELQLEVVDEANEEELWGAPIAEADVPNTNAVLSTRK